MCIYSNHEVLTPRLCHRDGSLAMCCLARVALHGISLSYKLVLLHTAYSLIVYLALLC